MTQGVPNRSVSTVPCGTAVSAVLITRDEENSAIQRAASARIDPHGRDAPRLSSPKSRATRDRAAPNWFRCVLAGLSVLDHLLQRALRQPIPLIPLLLLAFAPGCATTPEPVTLASWQRSVERYVWDQGNGDPNVLRDMSWDDVHKGFAVINDAEPGRSTDATGFLLAHRRIESDSYFIFLVALVQRGALEDLRPMALSADNGKLHWIVGRPDPAALAAYRQAEPQQAHDSAVTPTPPFPRPTDRFVVDVAQNEVNIRDVPTGIVWRLALHPPIGDATRASGAPQTRGVE